MTYPFRPADDTVQRDKARALVGELQRLLGIGSASGEAPSNPVSGERSAIDRAAAARIWLKARRVRETLLGADLFADPAWDMLLDLYIEHQAGRVPSVTSLCLAAHVPATTALRWIARLERDGLICRTADCRDGRRFLVRLAPHTVEALDELMDSFADMRAR